MAQAPRRPRRPGDFGGGGGRKFTPRRKVCTFCADGVEDVDYKDLARLRRFLSERGKIEPRRKTGTCAGHQRSLNVALKRARHLALLPFTAEHIRVTGVVIREPGMGPRGPRFPRREAEASEAPERAPEAARTETAVAEAPPPEAAETGAGPTGETPAGAAETGRSPIPAAVGPARPEAESTS